MSTSDSTSSTFAGDPALFDSQQFTQACSAPTGLVPVYRENLKNGRSILLKRFMQGHDARDLVRLRAWHIDQLLTCAFSQHVKDPGICLVAVGGYGRFELHPASDIDVLIMVPEELDPASINALEQFVTFLWDIGLDVGHAVRSVDETVAEAVKDITVVTNLIESRFLCGNRQLFELMCERIDTDHMWPSPAFFAAKLEEQQQRHSRFHDTAYNLEPNIKEGPGGLRDIQIIDWVAKRHFGSDSLSDLIGHGFLTESEYQSLIAGQDFLWKVRFGLHLIAGRKEDRLLFDHQRTLARQFGYEDDKYNLAVEHFMKQYYRTIMELARLNEMLLQLFKEVILHANEPVQITPINTRLQERNGYLEITYEKVFEHYPFTLLEIFLVMAQRQHLKGVRATTIRAIRNHRHLIDDAFRNDLRCKSLFMELLRQPRGITHELRRMNRYGILAHYLPVFGNIVGQMQHDLFHHYTVDEHTMFVVRNLRRLTVAEHSHELPFCSQLIKTIPKPEILYIAAIFHDIAKGRGGDHSQLGAVDAEEFCRQHGLSEYDTQLVSWLVRKHLLMSVTTQKKDISDTDVILEFARIVGNKTRLDYLYLLTVSDVRATNPELWNSWKDALLRELYFATSHLLRLGIDNVPEQEEWIDTSKASAEAILAKSARVEMADVHRLWMTLPDEYFLRHSAERIAWHSEVILGRGREHVPIILNAPAAESYSGALELFIYCRDEDELFAKVTGCLERQGLNIVDARIITTDDGYTLDTYIIFEQNGEAISHPQRIAEILRALESSLQQQIPGESQLTRHVPRRLKHFAIPTQVAFIANNKTDVTVMEVVASDRPGLLAALGQVFLECGVCLRHAKVSTIGERVEDMFFLSTHDLQPIRDQAVLDCLKENTVTRLNPESD